MKVPKSFKSDLSNMVVRGKNPERWVELREGQLVSNKYNLYAESDTAFGKLSSLGGLVGVKARRGYVPQGSTILILKISPLALRVPGHHVEAQWVENGGFINFFTSYYTVRPVFDLIAGTGAWKKEKISSCKDNTSMVK